MCVYNSHLAQIYSVYGEALVLQHKRRGNGVIDVQLKTLAFIIYVRTTKYSMN